MASSIKGHTIKLALPEDMEQLVFDSRAVMGTPSPTRRYGLGWHTDTAETPASKLRVSPVPAPPKRG